MLPATARFPAGFTIGLLVPLHLSQALRAVLSAFAHSTRSGDSGPTISETRDA